MTMNAPTKAIDFSRRNVLTELMDSDETDFATFRDCLIDLAKVNRLTLAYRPTLRFFTDLARAGRLPRDRAVSVVDVGSGFGDMLRKIDHWAAPRGLRLDLAGVDLNPWSARTAGGSPSTRPTGRGRPPFSSTICPEGTLPCRGACRSGVKQALESPTTTRASPSGTPPEATREP